MFYYYFDNYGQCDRIFIAINFLIDIAVEKEHSIKPKYLKYMARSTDNAFLF